MSDFFDAGKFGAVVPIIFNTVNAVTNAANTDMIIATGATLVVMPVAGSVVGISVSGSTATETGTAAFRAHSSGTEITSLGYPNPTINTTNASTSYAAVRPGAISFAAGASLGVSYSSATDLSPTNTNDFVAVLWVQLNPS